MCIATCSVEKRSCYITLPSISFNFSNVGKIFWGESDRIVPKFRRRKKIDVVFTYSIKRAREIRKIYVVNIQCSTAKKIMYKKARGTCKVVVLLI